MRLYKSLWGCLLFFAGFLFVGYHCSQSPHHLLDDRGTERGLAFVFFGYQLFRVCKHFCGEAA